MKKVWYVIWFIIFALPSAILIDLCFTILFGAYDYIEEQWKDWWALCMKDPNHPINQEYDPYI